MMARQEAAVITVFASEIVPPHCLKQFLQNFSLRGISDQLS